MRLEDVIQLVAEHGAERRVKRAGVLLPLTVGAMLPGVAHKAVERASQAERALEQSSDRANVMGKMAAAPKWEDMPESMKGEPSTPGSQSAGVWPHSLQHLRDEIGGAGQWTSQPGTYDEPTGLQSLLAAFGQAGSAAGSAGKNFGKMMFGSSSKPGVPNDFIGNLKALSGSPLGGVAQGISGGIGERIKRKLMGREYGEMRDPMHMLGTKAVETFGQEAGKAGMGLLKDIAIKAMDAAGHSGDDAARAAILGNLKRTDSVLSVADDQTLMEAYNTMKRFAPTLSTDKNAVRSFLRQAVMSGNGPDFMAIKLLSDAEKSVNWERSLK